MSLKIDTQAPDFTLPSTEGKNFSLKNVAGQPLVLYFYPKDFTRVCTKEACEFRDQFEGFRNLDVIVYGISTDNIDQHHKFREEHKLPFHLLSDEDGQVCKLYDAKIPFLNIAKRVTYLLNENHQIKAVYQDLFEAKNHIQTMLNKITNKM